MGLPCLFQSESNWKGQPHPLLSDKRDYGSLMEPNLGARRTTKHVWKLQAEPQKVWRANHRTKLTSACTRWTPKWTWKTCQSSEKVTFDIQPTNPQVNVNITATGHCEYWITTIDLMEYQEKSTLSSPDDTMLPEVYTDTVTCIYNL